MAPFEDSLIVKEDYLALNKKISQLKFINGVAFYEDKTATERRVLSGYMNKWENNLSLVNENGKFLTDIVHNYTDRFFNSIQFNKHGLFLLENHSNSTHEHNLPFIHQQLMDYKGNMINEYTLETVIKILLNRNIENATDHQKLELPIEMQNGRFDTTFCNGEFRSQWKQKEGDYNLCNGKERNDGLVYFYKIEGRNQNESEYVKDQEGNNIELNNFYKGIIMLQNGKKYWNKLIDFLKNK